MWEFKFGCFSMYAPIFYICCLFEKNHPTPVRRLTWVRSRQNGVFHFVTTNRLNENGFIPPRWDLTSSQVRSHLEGMILLHVNIFWRAVPPRQDCSFSLDSVCFYNYCVKRAIHLIEFLLVIRILLVIISKI